MSTTLQSINPTTGDVVASPPVDDASRVAEAVARAREEVDWWEGLGFAGRKEVLDRWRGLLARRVPELARIVHDETGKPIADAQLEIGLAIEHLAWATRHAEKVLGRKQVFSGALMINQAASLERRPLGVIGVIGPWNYPVFTPMGSIGYALAAGNTVVFKPSELTPATGRWLADTMEQVLPGRHLVQVLFGGGDVGAALCRAGVDKLAFTGSTATGKKVMATCAETLTPVIIEAGGKDALLVDEDADLDAAAEAAAWGAFSNAGQTCLGVERIYVHERVYDDFLARLTAIAREIRHGDRQDAQYGPMTLPKQIDVIRDHVNDALRRGGRAVLGGAEAVGERFVAPTILVDVPEDSTAVTEETFGPTVTVTRVSSMDEAVEAANAGRYGLGSTVFSAARGPELAHRLRCGSTAINGIITFAAIPALPMGGVGDSGFGRIHGADGLREFTYAKAVARQRFSPALALTTFARTEKADTAFAQLIMVLHGGKNLLPAKAGRRRR
ncbi:aldehyde dehydrogenase family protein [Leekyejoonella antrihumi]|uniref:Aldehyde dehydrogenase n=1 Tax=Leekyejoonella antrihumi TaxID=1660198 RepID=A0A563E8P7_9MICO|nr:aldehyde dehydrogenase family protein [Leekyejoonella antrihumi]TWP38623.1 aldehyde dehydrogenase family protein [Leekyejoonella antrihumi]